MQQRRGTDRRSEWQFLITEQGWSWSVNRPGGVQERAAVAYATLQQAGDDALAHGYGLWKYDERRRGDRRELEH